jgi:hypothetical protein
MAHYRRPFAEPGEGRRPTLTWPRQIPIEGEPADVVAIVTAYDEWLKKLFLKAEPGGILSVGPDLGQGDAEMKKWVKVAIPFVAILVVVAWYAFRPERLVVNRKVDEAMPTAPGASTVQPLESGQFYSILHPTEGTATIYQMADGTRLLRLTRFSTSNGPDVSCV